MMNTLQLSVFLFIYTLMHSYAHMHFSDTAKKNLRIYVLTTQIGYPVNCARRATRHSVIPKIKVLLILLIPLKSTVPYQTRDKTFKLNLTNPGVI